MTNSDGREYCINVGGKYLRITEQSIPGEDMLTDSLKEAVRVKGAELAERIVKNINKVFNLNRTNKIIAYKFEI